MGNGIPHLFAQHLFQILKVIMLNAPFHKRKKGLFEIKAASTLSLEFMVNC